MDVTKIIKAKIGHSNYVVAEPIMKEDYGLYLLIEGIDLPQSYEVDFSNELRDGTSITMIGDANGVRIPEQFIEPGRNVYAFYYHVGADFGRTLYTIRIPNRARPERTDEQPTPVQQSAIDQAISALNTAVERTAQDVISADQSAHEAGQSAEQAHEASIDAQNFAEQAEQSVEAAATSASQASTSASNAAQSASQSAQIKTTVEGMVDDAQTSAAASAQSSSAAAQSASSAATSASTAATKAAEAAASAASVGEAAQTATAKAAEASASSTSASGSASAAATSASTASTKAAEASASATAAQTAQTAAETAQTAAEDAQEAAETAAESIEASAAQIATNTADIADVKRDLSEMTTATAEDVGKALKAKTVTDGKVTEWEFGEAGGSNGIPFPASPESQYGTSGQVLETLGNGATRWKTVEGADPAVIEGAVSDWLDEHPEATTTVLDDSLAYSKLEKGTLGFVYPEQFGAIGDGITDDAQAIQTAIDYCIANRKKLVFMPKIYGIIPYQQDKSVLIYNGTLYALLIKGSIVIDLNGATLQVLENTVTAFCAVSIRDCSDVLLMNGTIIGDRETYTISNDNSQLLDIFDSKRIYIDRIVMKDSKGDCFGHTGVQVRQPHTTRPFEDFYMGNVISNCVMSHSVRHGMTFSKGRGVTFENCRIENVRPEEDLTWSGSAVDAEPYYGYGSVFDIRFIGCSMTDNANGPYIQGCDSVRFENCYLQGIGFRSAQKCMVSDSVILNGCQSNASGVKVDNCVMGFAQINTRVTPNTANGYLNNIVSNCVILGTNNDAPIAGVSIISNVDDAITGNVIIDGCHIDGSEAALSIQEKTNYQSCYDKIIFKNNYCLVKKNGVVSGSVVVGINRTKAVTIKNNTFEWDVTAMGQTANVLKAQYAESISLVGNKFNARRDQTDVTYSYTPTKLFAFGYVQNPIMFKDNVINSLPNTVASVHQLLIGDVSGTPAESIILLHNYVNNIYAKRDESSALTILVETGNVINNTVDVVST